jgi:hypothetical protein
MDIQVPPPGLVCSVADIEREYAVRQDLKLVLIVFSSHYDTFERPNRLRYRRLGRKTLGNEKLPKLREKPQNSQSPSRPMHAVLGGSSLPYSVTEKNNAVAKTTFLQKL